jgi:hypothetical protein
VARRSRFAAWLAEGLVSALDASVRVTVVDGERLWLPSGTMADSSTVSGMPISCWPRWFTTARQPPR